MRFNTLLVERESLDVTDSIVFKAQEVESLSAAIMERPIFGYGFGAGQYGDIDENLRERERFHNYFLGFALKTGIFGLAGLLGILVIPCVKAFRIAEKVSSLFPENQALLEGLVYGVIGTAATSISNPHVGTPAFVCELALLH
jgi:O-antigen ligase